MDEHVVNAGEASQMGSSLLYIFEKVKRIVHLLQQSELPRPIPWNSVESVLNWMYIDDLL